ncbi:probable carboxylesterase 2 [Fagus crenata]|uniref:Alpha/beta hydrolase fold-3 domain-containing protein n=1 Tax=Fagus sylvatica TaxID=28930 RepID=A0A2N9FYT9_FAGSY
MNPSKAEVSLEVPPYLRVYKDGTLERLAGTQVAPSGFDPQTKVESKDIVIIPETGVSARLYRLINNSDDDHKKLPLVLYFHGGAFCISSTSDPFYHNSLNALVADANFIVVSVNYRIAPEHPLPAAYEDCWAALNWVASKAGHDEPWLKDKADFERVFLVGDSAGANIAHHLAIRAMNNSDLLAGNNLIKLIGIGLINPYFWGEKPIGLEVTDPVRKSMVDKWWDYVCPSDKGGDDLLINPFVDGAPSLANLACQKVFVIVAEKDILRDRGKFYYEKLVNSEWRGKAEMMEIEGEDHVFHIFDPTCQKAKILIQRLASFINQL